MSMAWQNPARMQQLVASATKFVLITILTFLKTVKGGNQIIKHSELGKAFIFI